VIDADQVRAALSPPAALDHFGVRYQRRGDELRTKHCPTCGPRSREAVAINVATGMWADHAHGCRGDLFALVAGYAGVDAARDFRRVLELAASIAGLSSAEVDPEMARRIEERNRVEAARRARDHAERQAAIATMPGRWAQLERRSLIGERYLAGRGLAPAELRQRGDVVRFRADGAPAVALRDLATGEIVGIQYRQLAGEPKLIAERGSQVAGSALLGKVGDVAPDGVDVAILVEGLADTLAAVLAFPGCAVLGAPGWTQLEAVAAAVAPHVLAARGALLITVDDDDQGVEGASAAARAAQAAGLNLASTGAAGSVSFVELGTFHDLADAYAAGWRWTWLEVTA
jgi:hypothetical protein